MTHYFLDGDDDDDQTPDPVIDANDVADPRIGEGEDPIIEEQML